MPHGIIDAALCGQPGKKTQNTHSTGNRKQRSQKNRRYGKSKHAKRSCHSFTFGLLITPAGYRLPFQIPHYPKEYCQQQGVRHRTAAQSAADLIRSSLRIPDFLFSCANVRTGDPADLVAADKPAAPGRCRKMPK